MHASIADLDLDEPAGTNENLMASNIDVIQATECLSVQERPTVGMKRPRSQVQLSRATTGGKRPRAV